MNRLHFIWTYLLGKPRWDTNQTPPEVIETFQSLPSRGTALDLGCGTGTNAIFIAQNGWQVTGIDFVPQAVRMARRKARRVGLHKHTHFIHGDVSRLENYNLPLCQFALDIGCLHSLPAAAHSEYVRGLAHILEAGAVYMLYAFHPRESKGRRMGLSNAYVEALFTPGFVLERLESDANSSWYWLRRV
jgi:cyclopropane fatty-acyl-phospholipid synthase-like methyltransferase